ncbi:MAG: hypothetical protein IPO00_01530 [Betaproteobacteria bacterium]|nr:hypothetical protein [Betaproteobacteria bacterium]
MLFIVAAPLPYGYYVLLRFVATGKFLRAFLVRRIGLNYEIPRKPRCAVAALVCIGFLASPASASGANFPESKRETTPDRGLLERAIDGGDPATMNDVGVFYDDAANNANEALKWFLKGALAGSKPSRMNLAMALFEGRVFKQDRALALFWMRLAEIDGPIISEGYMVHPSMRRKLNEAELLRSDALFEKFGASQMIPREAIPVLPAVELPRENRSQPPD